MVYGKYSAIGVGRSQTLGDLYIDGRSNNGTVSEFIVKNMEFY